MERRRRRISTAKNDATRISRRGNAHCSIAEPRKPGELTDKRTGIAEPSQVPAFDARLTGPERALLATGLKPHIVARKMTSWRRPTPKQVEQATAYLRRVLRHGNAGYDYAVRLAHIIKCPANWLMLPRECWPDEALPNRGAMEREPGEAATEPGCIAGAGAAISRGPRSDQMTILRIV